MAEQDEPVRRRVALKIIKLGMDTKQVIARFEAERQALALMDHPNIARVLEAGASETGRPYFVMELVKGIKITDYCDKNILPTRQRLELFIQVCRAVQHAHQKGIIHRDLKPSNILVTLHDGVPVPKVIDFGIAKATAQRLADKTVFTAFEQLIGTPAYMSPEQAELSGLDIDTRSDIYSLGVLLYELLTSRIPFEPKELSAVGLDAMRQIIREKDPVRPSTKLSTLTAAEQGAVARQRRVEAPKLIHLVRGDLDWIVMKCLEKNRTRRYETANGLARDIERHLDNEPVVARPPSRLYRLQKTLRRNRGTFAAAGTVVVALVIGLLVSAALLVREQAEHRRADREARRSEAVTRVLKQALMSVSPSVARGKDTQLLQEFLQNAATNLVKQLTNQPEAEAEVRLIIGMTYQELGQYTNALVMTLEAARLRRLAAPQSVSLAEALNNLGTLYYDLQDWTNAEATHREALAIKRRLLGSDNLNVALSLNNLGLVRWMRGDLPHSEELHQEALRIRRQLLPPRHADIAESLNNLAIVCLGLGQYDRAENYLVQALDIVRTSTPDTPFLATMFNNVATLQRELGKLDESLTNNQAALALRKRVLPQKHPDIAYSQNNLAIVLQRQGNLESAEELHRAALALQQEALGPRHQYVAETLSSLAIVLGKKGDLAGAERMQSNALAMSDQVFGKDNPDAVDSLNHLGVLAAVRGDWTEAESRLRRALAVAEKTAGRDNPDLIPSLWTLGWVRRHLGDAAEADSMQALALTLSLKGGSYGVRTYTESLYAPADVLLARGDFTAAEPLLLAAADYLQRNQRLMPPFHTPLVSRLARLYDAWGKPEQAAAWRAKVLSLPAANPFPQTNSPPSQAEPNLSR